MNTITGRVSRVVRDGNTKYGNPIMTVVIEGDEYGYIARISDDATLAGRIENREFRETPHTFALTGAGRISRVIE